MLLALICIFYPPLNDINLKDDAFHSEMPLHIETWYYEAIFGNESIVFMITSVSNKSTGLLMTGLHFYRDGELLHESRKMFFSFFISDEFPYIIADGKEILRGYLDKEGNICYNISYSYKGYGISLFLKNTTKGWKTEGEKFWLALPNMEARGKILIDGKEKEVEGKGYHDHNIFFFSSPFMNRGYIDGKVMVQNLSIVWAKLLNNVFSSEEFVIVSEESYRLLSENVSIIGKNYTLEHGKFIPMTFLINAESKDVKISLTFRAKSIQFIRLPFIHYWRYHVIVRGLVKTENGERHIESFDIMEYMLFSLI